VIDQCRCPSPTKFTRIEDNCPFPEHSGKLKVAHALDALGGFDDEPLEADDTVPVERLAHWLQGEFGSDPTWGHLAEWQKDAYRRRARALMTQLPELFR
jgi:hypothetical protein